MTLALLAGLALLALTYVVFWGRRILLARRTSGADVAPGRGELGLGFVTNFFDTLGIGNFAPTAAVFRLTGMVDDTRIPGTMNVGHTLPVVLMAFVYIAAVEVEAVTLVTLIASAVAGAWVGAGLVARLPRRPIQIGLGTALLVAALLMVASQLEWLPVGGSAIGLRPLPLAFAAVACALFGALNTIGVGFYGPCMILVALLGMDPQAAFPIMMGSCAFLMPVGSMHFVQRDAYALRPALGLTLGGLPAVLIAAFLVQSLPLGALRWLVVVVATYTAVLMLRSAYLSARPTP